MRSKRSRRERRNFILFTLPAVIAVILVIFIPFIQGVYYSFTDWGGVIKPDYKFVGLKNYIESFTDTRFQYSSLITSIFAILNIIVTNLVGFGLALIVSSKVRLRNIYRTGFFIPNLIGGLVLGYIWQFIFNNVFPTVGQVLDNEFLMNNLFLGDARLAIWALVITSTWQYAGYIMMIYYAGLQSVPESMYEAAEIDGANFWQRLRHITIPMIMPSFTIALFLTINNSFKTYDVNVSLTAGGPSILWQGQAIKGTELMTMNITNVSSVENRMALGQARSVILFIILVIISFLQTTAMKRQEVEM